MSGPSDIGLDSAGDLFIADTFNNRIREVAPATGISVAQATPTVTVSDAGGTYNGSAFAATDAVAGVVSGVDTTPAASLEGVTPSLTYYSGTSTTGTALSGAPTSVGTYAVLASFAGSADYTSASASTTFTIIPATTIALSASANPITYGQRVNLLATVASTTTPSEGMVTFYFGSTTLGTESVDGGTAALNNVFLPAGVDVITAKYTDALGNFGSSSTTLGSSSIIRTIAGEGSYVGDGGPATAAVMQSPSAVAVDSAGDLFIARLRQLCSPRGQRGHGRDYHRRRKRNQRLQRRRWPGHGRRVVWSRGPRGGLRRRSVHRGRLQRPDPRGQRRHPCNYHRRGHYGNFGDSGDNGPATAAGLNYPTAIAVDAAGDIFIDEIYSNVVREVNAVTHVITTVAGTGQFASGGDNGPATAAG